MSLIDIVLHRRPRSNPPRCSHTVQPRFELLEARECMSVAAPTGLQAVAQSATQVKLTWNNVAGEQSFRIYKWDGVQTTVVGNVNKDVLTFTATGLTANSAYYFTVEARDLTTSARSAWVGITTPADPITAPTNVRITNLAQTSLTIQWNNATGATGYNVYGWDGSRSILLGSTTPLVPAFNVQNLSPGVTYYFYVQAFNKTNNANSAWVSATTLSTGIKAPANFKATPVNASTIALSWTNVVTATGYKVYQWDGQATHSPILVTTLAANTTGYQATGLLPGTNYWFYVQAFNATGSANTAWLMATTVAAAPLAAPTQFNAAVTGPGSVLLTWTEPARAVGYNVYHWTGFTWALVSTVTAGTHSVPITGLTQFQTHWFFVQAFTTNGAEVANSNAVFANL